MGAYYHAVIGKNKKRLKRLSSWQANNGAKLLEHSYLDNNYVNTVMNKLLNKPQKLGWLCDYHKGEIDWNNVPENKKWQPKVLKGDCYVINHDKKEYIDIKKYRELALKDKAFHKIFDGFVYIIHPVPLLTNSDKTAMGGGDYGEDYFLRGHWYLDTIEVKNKLPKKIKEEYTDITEQSLVLYE